MTDQNDQLDGPFGFNRPVDTDPPTLPQTWVREPPKVQVPPPPVPAAPWASPSPQQSAPWAAPTAQPRAGSTQPAGAPEPPEKKGLVWIAAGIIGLITLVGAAAAALAFTGSDGSTDLAAQERIQELLDQVEELENVDTTAAPTTTTAAPTTTTTAAPTTTTTAAPTTTTTAAPTTTTAAPTTTVAPTTPPAETGVPAIPTGYDDISDVEAAVEGLAVLEALLRVDQMTTVDEVRDLGRSACRAYDGDPEEFGMIVDVAWEIILELEPESATIYGGLEGWRQLQFSVVDVYCPSGT